MPTFRFQCSHCGLSEKRRTSSSTTEIKCSACGSAASRTLPESLAFNFSARQTEGVPKALNAGDTSTDYSFDRAVGESAKANWAVIADRVAHKRKIMQEEGVEGSKLVRLPSLGNTPVDYRVMDPEEESLRKKADVLRKRVEDLEGGS